MLSVKNINAQQSQYDTIVLPEIILADDTIPSITLPPVLVQADRYGPFTISTRDRMYLDKVYPYALRIARLSQVIEDNLDNCKNKKQKKQFLNDAEKQLRAAYEEQLKNMTRTQGNFMIKLVHRETGVTVFDLLQEYRGNFKTFWWNVGAKMFKLNLKGTYDAEGADKEMEKYVKKLDDIYNRNGLKFIISNEKFNLSVPSTKSSKKRNKSE